MSVTTSPVPAVTFNLQAHELAQTFSIREIEQIQRLVAAVSTHAQFWEECDRADWMLGFLAAHVSRDRLESQPIATPLREFACWCAREACANGSVEPFQTLLVAERVAKCGTNPGELDVVRHRSTGSADRAEAVGLPMGEPIAAIQLACYHAANPDPLAAARLSSSFASKAEQFRVAREHRLDPARTHSAPRGVQSLRWVVSDLAQNPAMAEAIASRVFTRQARVLRFLLPPDAVPW